VDAAAVLVGGGRVELLAATDEDTPVEFDVLANDQVFGGTITAIDSVSGRVDRLDAGHVRFAPGAPFQDLRPGEERDGLFRYTVTNDEGDATATVRIAVEGRNDAPEASPDSYEAAEDATLDRDAEHGVLGNDTDVEHDALSAVLVSPPSSGRLTLRTDGSLAFEPAGDLRDGESERVTFAYRASDGRSESATTTATILVNGVNDPPVLSDQAFTVGENSPVGTAVGTVAYSDPDDGQHHTLAIDSGNASGTFAIDEQTGAITVADSSALDAERNPSFDLIVSVRDAGGLSDTGRIHVAVADVDESPVAHDDAYVATGNTELAAGGAPPQTGAVRIDGDSVLNNDADPDGKGLSVTPASGRTAAGGHYEVDPAGAFSYIPPAGFTGSDSFPYEVGDGATTVTATVDITVERRIWYIDAGRPLPGDGTSAAPFTSLAAVGGSGTEQPDGPGDTIFLFGTGAYDGSIALESRERLVGQGVDLVVDDHTLVPRSTSLPRIQSTGAPAVTLGADNDLSGFTVRAIGAAGIAGSDFGTMTAALDAVEALGGRALDLHDGTAQADFGWLSSSASPDAALVLDHVGGNLDAASVELVDSGASAIAATDDDAAFSLEGGTIRSAAGGVTASGGGGALDIGAAVSTTGGNSVAVSERAPRSDGGCSVVLRGPIDDSGQGILLEQNDAGARTCFSGPLTLSTGTAPAFVARDGGTLSVTGDANVVTTTTGTGLYLDGVAIAGDGATFRSVSTDGAEYGIRVKSLASGGGRVAVTGTGSPDTGGLIQSASTGVSIEDASGVALGGLRVTRSTGDGVVLTDASDVSIRQSAVEDSGGSGIRGQRVSGLALGANVVVQRSDEDGIELRDVLGTSSVTQATLRDNHGAAQLLVANTSAGAAAPDILRLDSLTIDGSRGNLVDVDAGAGSNLQVLVGSGNGTSSFLRDGADGVHANAHDGGRLNLSVAKVFRQNGTGDAVALQTGGASAGGDSAQLTFDLSDNNSARGGSIVAPGGAGVRLTAAQGGVLRAAVRDNEIEQPGDDGVAIISSGGRVEPQVASNQITTPGCRYPGGFDSRCVKASGANACPAILAADQDIAGVSATASSGGTIEGRIQRNEVTDPLGGGVLAHVSGTASTTLELSGNRVTQTLPCDMLENPILADANGGTLHLTGGGNTLTLTDKARDGLVVDATGGSTATAMLAGDTIEGGRDGVHASAQGSSLSVDLSGLERTGGDRDAVHLHATGSSARLHAHVRDAAEAARGGIDSPARDGIALIGDDGAVVDGVVSGNEITSPGGAGVRVTGRLTEVAVESNHVTGARESAIAIDANGAAAPDTPAAELALDVAGNVVHDAGNPPAVAPTPESPFDPPPPVYDAIAVDSEQPGTAAARGNEVTGTVGARGIAVNGLGEPLSLTVADNRVGTSDAPLTGAGAGIAVTAANVCLGMTGNASFVASGLGYELDAEGPLFGLSDYDGTGVAQWLARHGNTGSAGWSGGLWPC
jgi:VCBS repeat-containing protein